MAFLVFDPPHIFHFYYALRYRYRYRYHYRLYGCIKTCLWMFLMNPTDIEA